MKEWRMDKNTWIRDSEKEVLTSPVLQIIEQNCHSSEDGRTQKFYLLRSNDWCNIIPITEDGKVVLVNQYRIGIAAHTIEVPGGVVDPGDTGPEKAAVREMAEETGYVPLPGARLVKLGSSQANPAILNNRVHSFIIGPVRKEKAQHLDAGEMIETVEVPVEDIPGMIGRGEIAHSLMLNSFLFALLRDPEMTAAMTRQLSRFRNLDP